MIIFTVVNRNNYYTFNNKKRIKFINNYGNFILYNYTYFEYNKFKYYYILYYYRNFKLLSIKYLNYSNEWHRENGPAYIEYYENGEISKTLYYLNDKYYPYGEYLLEIKKVV